MPSILYQKVLKPIFFAFDPELVHDTMVNVGELLGKSRLGRAVIALPYQYRGPDISRVIDGIRYETPVLLSAGFDTNARLTEILPSFGFGGEEIGSVTARPCEGNPKPRLTRLPESKSIVVYKGLRNQGVNAVIARLRRTPRIPRFVLGISLARTNDATTAQTEEGIADYVESYRQCNAAGVGDYYTINISCPNAFGGETFAEPTLLRQLLVALQAVPSTKPLYVKLPINESWERIDAVLRVCDECRVHGVVIGNLNKDYASLAHPEQAPKEFRGGLSGKPCFALSNTLIQKTRETYGKRFTIIGVGGIFSPEDALAKFAAGADLVQVITGMIYEGPGLIKEICDGYATQFSKRNI